MEILRSECEEMRQREKIYMEACEQDTELRIQAALGPYKNLPPELESLRAVVELRDQELHDLRHRNRELQRDVSILFARF